VTVKPTIPADFANGYIVTSGDWDLLYQQARYMQELVAGENADKIPITAMDTLVQGYYPNLLTNPGFERWQRGTAFTATTTAAYGPDRWQSLITGGSGLSIGQEPSFIDPAYPTRYACYMVYTHAGGGAGYLQQNIEDFLTYRQRQVTFTVRILNQCAVSLRIYDGVGTTDQAIAANGAFYTTNSVTRTLDPAATLLRVQVIAATASGTVWVDNCMVTNTAGAVGYQPLTPAEEDLRCFRYYQKVKVSHRFAATAAGQVWSRGVPLPVPMQATPAFVVTPGTRANVTTAAVANLSATSFAYNVTATAGVAAGTDTQVYDDVVTLDAG
jgi:hypothetical protein